MRPRIAFLAGLAVFPLAAVIVWAATRREYVSAFPPAPLDADTLARARFAQAMIDAGGLSGSGDQYERPDVIH